MGWTFEYLSESLHDLVVDNLHVYYKNTVPNKFNLEFDKTTRYRTEYGDGYPKCNTHQGEVRVIDEKSGDEILNLDIEYVIRRRIPDGLDYEDYENEYDIYLTKLGDFTIEPPEAYEALEKYPIYRQRIEKATQLIEQWNQKKLTVTDHQVIVELWDILTGKERNRDGKLKTRIKSDKN